ncbi:MAG: NYN domain-containing protein [Pseudoclavibacter sp.]
MTSENDGRVAVYIDFDNIVISRYNQVHGRGAFQSDRARDIDPAARGLSAEVAARVSKATVDIGAVIDYASSYGQIVVSRAYADWSQPANAGYRRQLIDRAIDLTQMFPLSATKNGADIRLAIDVVEDLFRLADVTHVVIVAGDSDYVALAQRVKRLGRTIVAVGVAGATSRALPAACNEFSLYDDLPAISEGVEGEGEAGDVGEIGEIGGVGEAGGVQTSNAVRAGTAGRSDHGSAFGDSAAGSTAAGSAATGSTTRRASTDGPTTGGPTSENPGDAGAPDAPDASADDDQADVPSTTKLTPRAATTLLRRALVLSHNKHGDDWLHASAVKQQMKRLDPSFHEKPLGYGSFTDFVKSRSRIAEIEGDSKGQLIRLRARGRVAGER